ncbi:MAG: hypothetical protein DDT32_01270 [Syntrophomonadaceae bacterium]|nr:hypothetical protein [Bacillota bacterium]
MAFKKAEPTPSVYPFPLLIKNILRTPLIYSPEQESLLQKSFEPAHDWQETFLPGCIFRAMPLEIACYGPYIDQNGALFALLPFLEYTPPFTPYPAPLKICLVRNRVRNYATSRISWSAVRANMPNMRWAIILAYPRTRIILPPNSSLSRPYTLSTLVLSLYRRSSGRSR